MKPGSFRRPAALEPEEAEAIVGDADPAGDAEVAHTSAWALLGVPGEGLDESHVQRLRDRVAEAGVDIVADLWDRSPAFTLPGALWRLYLLWQWNEIDPGMLRKRFNEGKQVLTAQNLETPVELEDVLAETRRIMVGNGTEDDIADALNHAAQAMRIMATGITYGPEWILEDTHTLAHPVTRRPKALLETADELEAGATLASSGELN
jgi:hypothetical protein